MWKYIEQYARMSILIAGYTLQSLSIQHDGPITEH